MRKPSRRTFLKTGAALAGATVAADTAIAQAPAITGGSESRFPSADAPGSNDGGLYRSADGGESWQRFDKVQVHGTIMSIGLHPSDSKQVYIGARYDGEVFGTQDAGKTWQAMPLPGEVQHIYSVACG